MKVVSLDVDSSERDPTVYPSPNDYTFKLNKILYGVTKIKLTDARIPNVQNLINTGNKQFQLDNSTYILREATYSNGTDLASNIQTTLVGSNVSIVSFNSNTSTLSFSNVGTSNAFSFKFYSGSNGYATSSTVGPPAAVMGFDGSDVRVSTGSNVLVSNVVDLSGPTSVFIRISCRNDTFNKDVYVNGGTFTLGDTGGPTNAMQSIPPLYIGRILLNTLGQITNFNSTNTPIEFDVPNLNVDEMRIRFYWNNGTKLIPYDFGKRNHIIKFQIECETDRFSKVYEENTHVDELPPPVDPPPEPMRMNNIFFIVIGLILFIGLYMLIASPRTPATGAPSPS
jgi:hypothetical protein